MIIVRIVLCVWEDGQVIGHRSGQVSGQVAGHVTGQVAGQVAGQVTGQVWLQIRSQVRLQVRSGQQEEYFSAKEIDDIFGGRTSNLLLGHASVK